MQLQEIIPGLYLVPAPNNGRFPYAHSFLVEKSIRALIDTGCGAETLEQLQQTHPFDWVISSHSHPDHTALNWKFAGKPLYVPLYAADTFGDFDRLGDRLTEPGDLAQLWRDYVSGAMNFKTALPTHTFSDGDVFDFGGITLVVVHTPGHTVDHTCLVEPDHCILFSFDIDLTSFGPWYGHRESDIAAFEASIRKVMALKPRIVVSSHKGIIADDVPARMQRFLDVFEERDRILQRLLPGVQSFTDLVNLSPFYQGYPYAATLLRYWESQMVRKHLERLIERGLVGEQWVEQVNHLV
jgi:glyoxylase-like metal-dependent hydrolase (beta-lactamase superfamily II)